MKKRFIVLVLCLLLAFSLAVTANAQEPEGSFVLAVCTVNNIVIEPTRIPYTAGQTVKNALLNSGYEFEGLADSGFIYSVEGVVANFEFINDSGTYTLDIPAASVTAMLISVTEVPLAYHEDMLSMVRAMADYNDMENHVQNYQPASSAYNGCLYAMRGDGSEAASKEAALANAIGDYESILNGEKYTVTVTATQYGRQVTSPVITMTDSYGNISTSTGSSIRVIRGDYTYSISDGGYNRTEGSIKVRMDTSISAALPEGEWFGEMAMRGYGWQYGYSDAYRCEQDTDNHKTIFYVDDTAYGYYGTVMTVVIGDVPDQEATRLRTIYVDVTGEDNSDKARSWSTNIDEGYGNFLNWLVAQGLEGRTFNIEGQYPMSNGQTQIQSYEIEIVRVPTLKDMTLVSQGALISEPESLALSFQTGVRDYYITTIADMINVHAEPFRSDYEVAGDGLITVGSGTTIHEITVTAPNGLVGDYTLHITRADAVAVTLNLPEGTTAKVTDEFGSVFTTVDGIYHLVPGAVYTCTATKNEYYHTAVSFVATESLTVDVPEPISEDWLGNLGIYSGRGYDQNNIYCLLPYPQDQAFESDVHQYLLSANDTQSMAYVQVDIIKPDAEAYARYSPSRGNYITGDENVLKITYGVDPSAMATGCNYFMACGGFVQTLDVRVETSINGVLYYQDYYLTFVRELHLLTMNITVDGEAPVLMDENGSVISFDIYNTDYYFTVNRDAENINLDLTFPASTVSPKEQYTSGYFVYINGEYHYAEKVYRESNLGSMHDEYVFDGLAVKDVALALDPEQDSETITIRVCHEEESATEITYTLYIARSAPVPVTISASPADTIVYLTSNNSGRREYDDNGVFMLTPGVSYSYNATRLGYVGVHGTYTVPAEGGVLSITLEAAPESAPLTQLSAQWPGLRADNNNNAVVSAPTPTRGEETVLYWAKKIGDGYSSSACSPPIMAGGYLYTYSGTYLYRIDPYTGEVVASAPMAAKSAFAINPPTYADGMIFVGLNHGVIQAFNASTLESLWVYTDPLGGQPNCSIVYHNGYVYTGFWVGEDSYANLVCISATDEDPSSPTEAKLATWTYASLGGFYWAGAYVCNNFLLVGTDDGHTSYTDDARLLSLDPLTGKLLSEAVLPSAGDVRSNITRYGNLFYFTSKGGFFFVADVDAGGDIQGVDSVTLGGMSTSTPTIYNGRAYVGVCGAGQFQAYSGHRITVIDVNHREIIYSVPTQGYPQTSGALTTAYVAETGNVYVYFFDNFTPGKLRVLEDKAGNTSPTIFTMEYDIPVAYNLFEPMGDQASFALCSPIIDEYGTLYFKNDSGYLMAVGSAFKCNPDTQMPVLEVTQLPDKTTYQAGEIFDPTGMKITAEFENGTSRDVTEYLTWSEAPLTAEDTDFQLIYPIVMYQNAVEDDMVIAGVEYPQPMAVVTLTIEGGNQGQDPILYGDVNGDDEIDMSDANLVVRHFMEIITLTEDQFVRANVDGSDEVDLSDFNLIIRYYMEIISHFPVENSP